MRIRHWLTAGVLAAVAAGTLATPALATPTAGSGGALTDRLNQSFTANGITSTYHISASGLDWSKEVGMLLWMDGSGGYGFDNPNSTYAMDADGTAGLEQVARDNNMILLFPQAPAPSCDGADNCWYNETGTPSATSKSDWLRALVNQTYAQYNIEKDRVAIGGYSSGAQATSRWFVPKHGAAVQTDGVFVPVAYGGAPAVPTTFTADYKSKVVGSWDTGTADAAYSTASYGAIGGYNSYKAAGFTVDATWPAGVGHARDGQFDDIMRREIAQWVRPAATLGTTPTPTPTPTPEPTPTPTPEPTPAPAPAPWDTTVTPSRTGGSFATPIPSGYSGSVYVKLSDGSYVYETGQVGPKTLTQTFTTRPCGTTLGWRVEAPSGTLRDSGTFTTLPC